MDYRHLSADAVIHSDDGLVFMRRAMTPEEGKWALPGGMVELGETASEAAEREAKEETGLEVSAERFVGLFDSPERDERGNVSAAYVCRTVGGRMEASSEASEVALFDPDDLPAEMAFDHRAIVEAAKR